MTSNTTEGLDRGGRTLVQLLQKNASEIGAETAFTFLSAGASESTLSFSDLDAQARRLAVGLLGKVEPGDRVVLLCPPGLSYVALLFGCLYAGAVAVPLYPPRLKRRTGRISKVLADCEAKLIATTDETREPLHRYFEHGDDRAGAELVSITDLTSATEERELPDPGESDLAFIQYTSGSTGDPKGVMVYHRNIAANLAALKEVVHCDRSDVFVNWLPLFHDMGLVITVMLPVFLGAHSVVMSPASFVQNPSFWLEAISRFRGTICGAPNFAFELCVEKVNPSHLHNTDLSGWRVAFNAAEPISAATLDKFSTIFAPVGFRHCAFYPAYGMAEATVFLAGGSPEEGPVVRDFAKDALRARRAIGCGREGRRLVASGRTLPDHALRVVDPHTCCSVRDGAIGEIWASGPSIAGGYWGMDAQSEATFRARIAGDARPFLRTGDLGFFLDGQIYISGRLKDVIIVRGQNYYPQDLEIASAHSHAALTPNAAAAFSVNEQGTERVVVVQEVRADQLRTASLKDVSAAISRAIAIEFELKAKIVLIRPATLPKTSSGKVQRSLTKTRYLCNALATLHRSEPGDQENFGLEGPAQVQRQIISIFQDVLRHDSVTLTSDFFELGGDSLDATRLIAAIERTFGVKFELEELYQASTVVQLAARISSQASELDYGDSGRTISAVQGSKRRLSFAQRRLWTLSQIEEQNKVLNLSAAYTIHGEPDVEKLGHAFSRMVERHEVLRTTYSRDGSAVWQHIRPASAVTIELHDLRHAEGSAHRAERLMDEIREAPFDLEQGPVFRVNLLQLQDRHYQLLLTMHHIAVDAWSAGILIEEIKQFYEDPDAKLAAPEIRYSDFAGWEAGNVAANRAKLIDYWSKHLADAPALLPLPYDRRRPARQTFSGAVHIVPLSNALISRLEAVGHRYRTTLFVTLLSAFQLELKRLSGLDDIVVGTDVANRNHAQLGGVVGFFVNQLVLRNSLRGLATFDELVCSNRKMLLEALAHQDMPFDQLVDELRVNRDARFSPVFQVKFLLNWSPLDCLDLPLLSIEPLNQRIAYSQFDLTLSIDHGRGSGFTASLHYNKDLFDSRTVAAFMSDYLLALETVVAQPEIALSAVPCYQTQAESYLRWGVGECRQRTGSIKRRFELQAREHPEAIALVCDAESLTYRELNEEANKLAHFLADIEIACGTLVGLHLNRSINQIVALLAVVKLGATFLPLDQEYPTERVEHMLADSMVQFVITDDVEHPHLDSYCGAVIPLDRERMLIAAEPMHELESDGEPDGNAYLLYTSGSAGRPKGVLISNASLLNLCCWYAGFAELTNESSVLHSIPLSFDASIKNILAPLMSGAKLVLPATGPFDPTVYNEAIEGHSVSVINTVPSLFYALLEQARRSEYRALRSLEFVALGGESTDMAQLRRWLRSSNCRSSLANLYGPTECTDISVAYRAPHAEARDLVSLPIGRPIHNANVYVVNPDLSLAPPGVAGELLIAGVAVGKGYIGQADANDNKFVTNPAAEQERAYRSGDMVRWDRNGQLYYQGRLDEQIKVNGVRIELPEIESALADVQGIKRAAVIHVDERLVAYVATSGLTPPSPVQLREHLRKRLPQAWVPKAFVLLGDLPLLPNGKVDRVQLKEIPVAQDRSERQVEPPTTEMEQHLVEIFGRVLGIGRVGIDEGFFELGGDSMSAVKVVALAAEAGISLSVADIFELQTGQALARGRQLQACDPRPGTNVEDQSGETAFDMLSSDDLSALVAMEGAPGRRTPPTEG